MAKKPVVKKKPAVKKSPKAAVKKVEPKKVEVLTTFESKVLVQVGLLFKDNYNVHLECVDRNISIKKNTDVLSLLRTHEALNLYGMKSGCPVRAVQIR